MKNCRELGLHSYRISSRANANPLDTAKEAVATKEAMEKFPKEKVCSLPFLRYTPHETRHI